MLLAFIIRLLISVAIVYGVNLFSKKQLKVSLAFLLIAVYFSFLSYALVGVLMMFCISIVYTLWIKSYNKYSWRDKAYKITKIFSIIYIIIHLLGAILKIILEKPGESIILKISLVFLNIFFLISNNEVNRKF